MTFPETLVVTRQLMTELVAIIHESTFEGEWFDWRVEQVKRVAAEAQAILDAPVPDYVAVRREVLEAMAVRITEDTIISPRELEVLALVAEGLSDKAVGDRLSIARSTVKGHMVSISSKLGQTGRVGIVMEALRRGLIEVKK